MRLSAAPKGTGWNDSGTQRMENYFYFAGAGAVADPGGVGGGDVGPCLSPGAPVSSCPMRHRPGTLFGRERTIPEGLILALKVPFLIFSKFLESGDNSTPKKAIVHQKVRNFYFRGSF